MCYGVIKVVLPGLRFRAATERTKNKLMKFVKCAMFLLSATVMFAASKPGLATGGVTMYIAPMEGGLDGFIATEIIKQKIPVKVVMEEKGAEYVLVGASLKADDHWYNTVFNGKDKNEGNVRLLEVKAKRMVWAGEAGDRSLWWGGLRRGGQRKVADRIVRQLKSAHVFSD
jgi:hypothetical protein